MVGIEVYERSQPEEWRLKRLNTRLSRDRQYYSGMIAKMDEELKELDRELQHPGHRNETQEKIKIAQHRKRDYMLGLQETDREMQKVLRRIQELKKG